MVYETRRPVMGHSKKKGALQMGRSSVFVRRLCTNSN